MTFVEAWEFYKIAHNAIDNLVRQQCDHIDELRARMLLFMLAQLCILSIQDKQLLSMLKTQIEKRG